MAGKLAVEASDLFAAAAISEAVLHELDSGQAKRMIPLVLSMGTKDDRFYSLRGLPELPFNDSILPMFAGTLRRVLDIFHLSQDYTKDSTAFVLRYRFNTLAAAAWYEFDFLLFNGLEHSYPNGDNYPLSMPNLLWPFFQQFTLQSAVKPASPPTGEVTVWPNPAKRMFTVDATDITAVSVRSILGEIVYQTSAYSGQRHMLPELPAGIYFVEVQTKGGQHFTKLLLE